MLLLLSFPVSRWLWACPPLTCAAGGTWLGCWWRGLGDGSPRKCLEFLVLSPGVVRVACWPQWTLEFPLESCSARGRRRPPQWLWVSRLVASRRPGIVPASLNAQVPSQFLWCPSLFCPPPPSPFPRTTVLVPIPSRPTGEYFRGRPARPLPFGSPCPWTRWPPNRCHGPLSYPPSPFLCHARGPFAPSPKLAHSGDHSGPWKPRATSAGTVPRLQCLLTTGPWWRRGF